jgi:hypothetical protein
VLPADPASRAGSTPEASSDWSSGTFGKQMKTALWMSFATLLITSLTVSLVSLAAPAVYSNRPPGMPWPILTDTFFSYGRWIFLLAFPSLYFSIRASKVCRLPNAPILALINISACILLIVVSALSMILPIVNTLYWD